MICFHGTTEKGLQSIINGIDAKHEHSSVWHVSDNDGAFYCWPMSKIEQEDYQYMVECGIDQAFESAKIQAAFNGSSKVYAIQFKISKEYLEDDYSCENMSEQASFLSMDNLHKIEIIAIFECNFNQYFAPFLIAGLLQNLNFNQWSIDEKLLECAQAISGSEIYIDSLFENDYQEVTANYISQLKAA